MRQIEKVKRLALSKMLSPWAPFPASSPGCIEILFLSLSLSHFLRVQNYFRDPSPQQLLEETRLVSIARSRHWGCAGRMREGGTKHKQGHAVLREMAQRALSPVLESTILAACDTRPSC